MNPSESQERVWKLDETPEELSELPEPLRTKALEAANELLEKDPEMQREEALHQAVSEAWEFHATRMPHGKQESGDDEGR